MLIHLNTVVWKGLQTLFACLLGLMLSACGNKDGAETKAETSEATPDPETIYFGVYTADKASKVVEQFAPTIMQLEKEVSAKLRRPIRIRLKISSDYETGINDLTSGKVQFSRLGPASFIVAKDRNPELQLLVMESKKGNRNFSGIIAVHKDSPIESLAELKGLKFAFGDSLSTIGRYLAQAELLKAGLTGSHLASFEYLGRHDTVGMAIAAGDYDAGALKESTFKSLVEDGQPIKALHRVSCVTKPWVAHPSLAPDITEALRSTFLSLKGSSVSKDGFLSAEEQHYEPIRIAMRSAQNF